MDPLTLEAHMSVRPSTHQQTSTDSTLVPPPTVKLTPVHTVGLDFKARPSTLTGDQGGESSLDQLPVHKASIESRLSVRVDVCH